MGEWKWEWGDPGGLDSIECMRQLLSHRKVVCPCFRINRLHRWYDYEIFTTIHNTIMPCSPCHRRCTKVHILCCFIVSRVCVSPPPLPPVSLRVLCLRKFEHWKCAYRARCMCKIAKIHSSCSLIQPSHFARSYLALPITENALT